MVQTKSEISFGDRRVGHLESVRPITVRPSHTQTMSLSISAVCLSLDPKGLRRVESPTVDLATSCLHPCLPQPSVSLDSPVLSTLGRCLPTISFVFSLLLPSSLYNHQCLASWSLPGRMVARHFRTTVAEVIRLD